MGTGDTAVERSIPGDLGGSICRMGERRFWDFLSDDLKLVGFSVKGISWGEKIELWFVGEEDRGLRLDDLRLDCELCTDSSVRVSAFKERGAGRGRRLRLFVCFSLCSHLMLEYGDNITCTPKHRPLS